MSSRLFHTIGSSHTEDLDDHYCYEVMLVLSHVVVGARLTVVFYCRPEKSGDRINESRSNCNNNL